MPMAPKGGSKIAQVEVNKNLSTEQAKELLQSLQNRFEENMNRHKGLNWENIQKKLQANNEKLKTLVAMERTEGEPDVIDYDQATDTYIFCDCSAESPANRRSICYDQAGEDQRIKKGIHPGGNAIELAKAMGAELMNEEQYRKLQEVGEFDTKTSSWLQTPDDIRELGGAIFGDRRFNTVFIYHNGAESFYSARGFRGVVKL